MKKLILVTLLAVGASWLLSEVGPPVEPQTTVTVESPNPPAPRPRHDGKRKRDGNHVVLVQDPAAGPTPRPLGDRREGEGPRPKRATATPSGPKAKPAPPSWFPKSEDEELARAQADPIGIRAVEADAFGSLVLVGRISASEDRARQDLRLIEERKVADWLAADVPPSWKVPASVIDAMVQGSYVQEVTRNLTAADPSAAAPSTPEASGLDGLYTLYRAGQKLDFSSTRRASIVGMYRHDLATRRLQRLGGGMALALVALAVLSGYIKADEATKGYYTNRLRLLAAAGLGVAGVAAYRFLA